MREIKLRAWDKLDKKWVNCNVLWCQGHLGFCCIPQGRDSSQLEITQYIGRKDSKGVEIYEEDIVRIWDYGFRDGEYGLFQDMGTDTVTMDRFPIYWLKNEGFGCEGEDLINPEHCEVIGNIYENKELLKEAKK